MQTVDFDVQLEKILSSDQRYSREAYSFVREALDFTQRTLRRSANEPFRHVSGQQLLDGARDYAVEQYGPMALTVLSEWGLRSCDDIGEVVFNMIAVNLLSKTDQDSREDFKGGYDFAEAFANPFLPSAKLRRRSSQPQAA